MVLTWESERWEEQPKKFRGEGRREEERGEARKDFELGGGLGGYCSLGFILLLTART